MAGKVIFLALMEDEANMLKGILSLMDTTDETAIKLSETIKKRINTELDRP